MRKFIETEDITNLLRNIDRDIDFDITYLKLDDDLLADFIKYSNLKIIDDKRIFPSINKQIAFWEEKNLSVGLIMIPSYDKFVKYAIEFTNE